MDVWSAYQLGVEFGQPGLAIVVEDEHCVDHYFLCFCVIAVVVVSS